MIAVCYLIGIVAVIGVVSGVEVYERTAGNNELTSVGCLAFVNVKNVPSAEVGLSSFKVTAFDTNDTAGFAENNVAIGSRVEVTTLDGKHGVDTAGDNGIGTGDVVSTADNVTFANDCEVRSIVNVDNLNKVVRFPVSLQCLTVEIECNDSALNINGSGKVDVSFKNYVEAVCKKVYKVFLVCNGHFVCCINKYLFSQASANRNEVKFVAVSPIFHLGSVTGCRNGFLNNGCISTSGAVLTCGQTVFGTSSSYCLVNNDVVTESIGVIGIVAITACASVDGVAICRTCGINYGAGSMNMCVVEGRNGFCYNITASSANLVFCAFCTFGSGSIDNPITIGVTQSIGDDGFSGDFFSANGTVNYVIVATGVFAGSSYRVFNNGFAACAFGHLFTAPITVVVIGDVLAMRVLSAAPITEVILISILTIAHLIFANVALVIFISVDTFGSGKTAEVTFVVIVEVCALSKLCAANVTLVIVVAVCTFAKLCAAKIAFVILVVICTIGHLFTAPITVVVIGDVLAMRVLSAAPITEVILISILTIAHLIFANVALVIFISVDTFGSRKTAEVTFVIEIEVCALGECFATNVALVIVVQISMLGNTFFATLVTGCVTSVVVNVLARSLATLGSGVRAGQLVNNYVCLTGSVASEEGRIVGRVVSQPVASIGALRFNGCGAISGNLNGPTAVVIQCGLGL